MIGDVCIHPKKLQIVTELPKISTYFEGHMEMNNFNFSDKIS